ncbi:hypothetical protein [Streptomyces sp. S.PNR 29]|uniref:hypothetical protein n=1 Tax=Streptomyces sp. S.PNR 29 TaxID=2973805 RepID=UPI0025AFF1FE|nr:hypothetical protein [Streptomyces sp. S.PNR 29]MDN0197166.1 hypothetical protein [Streptomyces sp. S.PNR 29]
MTRGGGRTTQAFPETGRTDVRRARSGAAETELLRGRARWFSDAAETQVLPSTGGPQGLPQAGRGAAETEMLPGAHGARRTRGAARSAAETEILSATRSARRSAQAAADTEVLPAVDATRALPESGAGGAAAPRDPWQDGDESAGHTHDPHEVTVQLDAVQLGEGILRRAAGGADTGRESSDGPVFVDESGRRSRTFRRIGIAVGAACAIYAVVIVATLLSGNSKAPWLPVPGPEGRQAGQVDSPPLPAESAPPSGTGGTAPGSTPSPTGGTSPTPGVSAPASGASTAPDAPGTVADPRPPTPARSPRTSGTGVTVPDPTEPTDSPAPDEPTATPTSDEPAVGPTETTGTADSAGTDPAVAAGPA